MQNIGKILILFILIYCIGKLGHSQFIKLDPQKSITQYTLKSWTIENGLPSNALLDIIQTTDGYIWIASYGGIIRFDGIDFTVFTSINTQALLTEACKFLLEDENGTLWIGTQKGIALYKNNKFYRNKKLEFLDNCNIEALYADKNNDIWIGTNANGLFRYVNDSLIHIENLKDYTNSAVFAILEDNDENIWIGTFHGELLKFKNNSIVPCDMNNTTAGIFTFFQDNDGTIWVGASTDIFTIVNDKLLKQNLFDRKLISEITSDYYKLLWFSSSSAGMFRYDANSGNLVRFSEENGLPNNHVTKIIFDNQGNLWGTTYRKGLFQITDGKFTCYSSSEGLNSDVTTAILEYSEGVYWIATENGAINILENGKISELHTKTQLNPQLKHIFKDSKKNVWISSYGGLLKISNKKEKLYNIKNGFPDNYIRLTFEDSKGNIWVGTNRTGLHRFNPDGSLFTINHNTGLSSNYVMAINENHSGQLIVGTKSGINIIENEKVIKQYQMKDGLPDNLIFNIYIDEEGIIWLSTNGGLCRMQDTLLSTISIESGLPVNTIFDVLEDNSGNFWMPSPKGIIKASKTQLNDFSKGNINIIDFKFYNKSDGMKSSVCLSATKSLKAKDGKLWFTTAEGIASINPENIEIYKELPTVIIEKITTSDSTYKDDIIQILHKNKRFTIKFTTLDYISPEKIQFKYKLEPFENDWIDAGTKRTVSYTNIDPGTYTFKVLSTNSHGIWSETSSSIKIIILPAWYQTLFFRISAIIFIFGFILILYRLKINRIRKQKIVLENQVLERTSQIELQKEEIQAQTELLTKTNLELEKLSLVASETINAVTIMDNKGRFEWVNEGFEKFYELSLEEFKLTRGKSIFECTNNEKILEKLRTCLRNKVTTNYEFSTYTKSGRKVIVQTTITPILDEHNNIKKLISIDTDISELKKAEQEIIKQRDEITKQKLEITDSIIYSKQIQTALFPTKQMIEKIIPNSFIINMPKEIIGGDFFWIAEKNIHKIIAVADCTGHGVPGALMSMLGISFLNEIVINQNIIDPGEILNQLRNKIIKNLHQNTSDESNREGLDIAICSINNETHELKYAGANNPAIITNKNKFIELTADKIPVMLHQTNNIPYTVKTTKIEKEDTIFLFTDGFADQFGGNEGRKFRKQQVRQLFKDVSNKGPGKQKTTIQAKFELWKGQEEQIDDILILGFSIT